MKDERLYLIHIAECIEKIEQYTIDGKSKFLTDSKTHDAVIQGNVLFAGFGLVYEKICGDTYLLKRRTYDRWNFEGNKDG